jgi:hypothetical protein
MSNSRKIFIRFLSTPKLSTEENTCLFYTKYAYYTGLSQCSGVNPRPLFSLLSIFLHQPKRRFCLSECCSLNLPSWLLVPAQLLFQPQLLRHSEQSVPIISTVASSRRPTSQSTQNLETMPPQPGRDSLFHKRVLCKAYVKVIREITVSEF